MKPEEKTITLETVLLSGGPLRVTDIETRDLITFFRIDGELFCTAGHHIHHESDKFNFDGPLIRIWAKNHKDPEAIVQDAQSMDRIMDRVSLWMKHRQSYLSIVFPLAVDILTTSGPEAFVKFVEAHLDITGPETDSEGENLLDMLEKQSNEKQ